MKCLMEEDFSRYFDNECDDSELKAFIAHLDSCRFCRERLSEMEGLERRFFKSIMESRTELQRSAGPNMGHCPSEKSLLTYLHHESSLQEKERIECHLNDCDACIGRLRLLSKIHASLLPEDMEPVPEELKGGVLQKWQQHEIQREDQTRNESLLRLAIRIVATGLEILSSSIVPSDMEFTRIVSATSGAAFRSVEDAAPFPESEVLVAKKQIIDKDLHIALMIRKESDQLVSLGVKLSKGETPFSDTRVSLLKDRLLFHSKKSGSSGDVEFRNIPPGVYILKIPSELIQWPIEITDQ
ncbi:MAG: zf-HC2 domain-containing protein [Syntrophaceae bacterium]|nr:zf-HC2 domain-containing protein [Syntrophaceae bacterium]